MSLQMAPFDRPCTTFCWSAIVNIAVSCTVFELFLKVIQTGTIRQLRWGFLFAIHSNYSSASHVFWDKARYWSKIVIFHTPPLHSTPPLGGPRRNTAIPFGVEKLEWWGYPMVKKLEDIYNRLDRILEYRHVTCDGRTDGWYRIA